MTLKVILFDYDGVLVNSFPNIHKVYQIICQQLGRKCPTDLETFRKIYGYSYVELRKNLNIPPEEYTEVERIYREEILKQQPPLFEGIKEVIQTLSQHYTLILLSNNVKEEVLPKLTHFGLLPYFKKIIAEDENYLGKTESILQLMKEFSLASDQIVFIGDRDIDYDLATKAGLKHIILVEYGWGYSKEKLDYNPLVLIKKPQDLLEAIDRKKPSQNSKKERVSTHLKLD